MQLKLFSGTRNASSWAMRAWLALREVGIEFDEEIVDIRKPQRFCNLARVGEFSAAAQVPVLVVDGHVIADSLAIMEFANDLSGGGLFPRDLVLRGQARAVASWQHSGLSGICHRISFESAFYPVKRALTAAEDAEAARLFRFLEPLLAQSGGPFLFGEVSLADFALTPTVVRLSRHRVGIADWPLCQHWAEAILAHREVDRWLGEADQLPHIWFEDYLLPGELFDPAYFDSGEVAKSSDDVLA